MDKFIQFAEICLNIKNTHIIQGESNCSKLYSFHFFSLVCKFGVS